MSNGRWRSVLVRLATPAIVLAALAWRSGPSDAKFGFDQGSASVQPKTQTQGQRSAAPQVHWTDAEKEFFEAVEDRTTALGVEELPAYWQTLRRMERTPFAELTNASGAGDAATTLDRLMQEPASHRGAPVSVRLEICRILPYDVPQSPLKTARLYEVWGWRMGAPQELYVAVTDSLPEGMAWGPTVAERGELRGYFFKLQGYLAAGAERQLAPQVAPLVIGRIAPCPLSAIPFAHGADWGRMAVGMALLGSLATTFLWRTRQRQRQPGSVAVGPCEAERIDRFEAWLQGDRTPRADCRSSDACPSCDAGDSSDAVAGGWALGYRNASTPGSQNPVPGS